MGLAAAGAYLQHVRVLRKVSRVQLAAQVGMSDDQIRRLLLRALDYSLE